MRELLGLARQSRGSNLRPSRPSLRPQLECLEDRHLFATGITATVVRGTLSIKGTPEADTIRVYQVNDRIYLENYNGSFAASRIQQVSIASLGGEDVIDLRGGGEQQAIRIPSVIRAGAGNDVVYGGEGNDTILGEQGNDTLYGVGGNDVLRGGAGNDVLFGELGNDRLYGEAGIDILDGGDGAPYPGGNGNSPGNDWLEAGSAGESAVNGWNAHRWAQGGTSLGDIDQGGAGTCSLLAALGSAVRRGMNLTSRIRYLGNFRYRVTLFDPFEDRWTTRTVRFTGAMVKTSGGRIVDPGVPQEGEFWTVLYQRAYLLFYRINPLNGNAVARFDGDYIERALKIVTGRRIGLREAARASPTQMQGQLARGDVLVAGSKWNAWDPYVVENHAYVVDRVFRESGDWYVRLFNPWGVDGYYAQGDDDGFVTVSWRTFVDNFTDYAWAYR